MQFKEIIGQENIKSKLIQTVQEQRISHALLFLGPDGSGNLGLAIAYAQYVACTNKQANDSCGECPSCNKYQKLIHPDLHFVFPVATTKAVTKDPVSDEFIKDWREAILSDPYLNLRQWYDKIGMENKQGNIGKSESREIYRKLNLKTYESDYKIMIIWMADRMNSSAANKLLKLIEEPPEKTLFLLVTNSSDNMLQTILSRCQLIKIPRIDDNSLHNALKQKFNLDEKILANIVHLSKGNYQEALNIINSGQDNEVFLEHFINIMRLSYARKLADIIDWAEQVAALGREKQKAFLSYSLKLLRENFIKNISQPNIVYMAENEAAFADKFSPFINGKNISRLMEEFNLAQIHIEANGNGKIIFMDLALKIVKLIK